jgi:hypothetical protein
MLVRHILPEALQRLVTVQASDVILPRIDGHL